jgi:hypothetical protein
MTDVTDFENPKKYFYVSNCGSKKWLSVELDENGNRDSVSFERWHGNRTDNKVIDIDNPLVQIYLEEFDLDWPIPHAYLRGSAEIVKNSDWIVKEDGVVKVYSNNNFESKFQRSAHLNDFYDQMYKCLSEDREALSAEFRKNNL